MKIAFIGLGTMGFYMAGHLQHHHQVTVFNRTPKKALEWQNQFGGDVANSPKEAALDADLVMTCVGNDDDVRSVVYGEAGALVGMKSNSILVDHTTTSPTLARELAQACQAAQVGFVDAPVSGGSEGAKNGKLTIMCGGTKADTDKLKPALNCYAVKVTHIGDAGAGQAAKMINQICVVGVLQSLAEGLHLAKQLNLNVEKVMEAISQGAASSWQMTHRWQSMLNDNFTPGFAVKWMAKDLDICLAEAKQAQANLPTTKLICDFYRELQAQGDGELDITRLISRL